MSYLKEVIANRRSIRKYQSQSIEKEKIIEVLKAGNLAI
jgi:nitroreductase